MSYALDPQKLREIEAAWNNRKWWWDKRKSFRKSQQTVEQFRAMLCERQNWRCCYCGIRVQDDIKQATDSATLEHVVPRCHGGPDDESNIVIACFECNNSRGDGFSTLHIELLGMYERGEIA